MKGICFIELLFISTVKGIKKQTRRIMLVQPDCSGLHNHTLFPLSVDSDLKGFWGTVEETGESKEFKPRYNIGEILYLKEPYISDSDFYYSAFGCELCREGDYLYRYLTDTSSLYDVYGNVKWQNKLFMPASAARYFIKITNIRAEKLQDISYEDCIKEGIISTVTAVNPYEQIYQIPNNPTYYYTPKQAYAALIDNINGKGTWDSNPFVWVYDYELIDNTNNE